ncbi:MAG: RAD55 family ATPase [Bacteroidota bacterium]
MSQRVTIGQLVTGVPGLDTILGGGLPEFSFNLIIGAPGSGKTTLANQIMFELATPERPALFFTALGEPTLKMLRYQQQFSFFNFDKIDSSIRFASLGQAVATGSFEAILEGIVKEIGDTSPGLIFVDSFHSIMMETSKPTSSMTLQLFIQQLGIQLSCYQATTFLIQEYFSETNTHPVFTVADGLISLSQDIDRNSMVRKIQVMKMRGKNTLPGMHTFRITEKGLEVYPAAIVKSDTKANRETEATSPIKTRVSMGVPDLDEMLGGGLPSGYSMLVAGPSGSGKTILATAFLAEGVRCNEPGVIVAFEQTPSQSWVRTLDNMIHAGKIGLINTRSLDLSIDEIVQNLITLIHEMKATRVVIDSLSGFELAIAPAFRENFRESLFRMVAVLSNLGVTVLLTSELEDRYTDLRFSPYGAAFLTDAIIVQRYIEMESRLQRVMAVVKVRASSHSNEIRQFEITDDGIVIGERVSNYEGLLGGHPSQKNTNDNIDKGKLV